MTRRTHYLIAGFIVMMGTQGQLLPTNQPTNASLTTAQKLAQAKLASSSAKATANKQKLAALKTTQSSKSAPKKPTTPPMTEQQKSSTKESQEHGKLIQDFLTAAKKLPDYHATKDHKSHEKNVEKVFDAYKKMQSQVKQISLTKSDNDNIKKAANNLFDYKHIEHMPWRGYTIIPDSKSSNQKSSTTPIQTPTKK